jgi:hypothetical protein
MKNQTCHFFLIISLIAFNNFFLLHCSISKTPNTFDLTKVNNKSNFEINIVSNKSEYYQLEPVWVTVQIKNIGTNVDSINIQNSLDLLPKFFVTDSIGNKLSYQYLFFRYRKPNYIKLMKDEQTSYDVELSLGFSENKLGVTKQLYLPRFYFSKGKYSVILQLTSDFEMRKEMMHSNKIEFTVKPPENYELNIFNRLIEISKIQDVKSTDWDEYLTGLKNLYDSSQYNIYSDEIFYNYVFVTDVMSTNKEYRRFFTDNFINDCTAFFDKYPDSFYSENILESFITPYIHLLNKSKQDVSDFLDTLINKYPDTKIQKAALNLSGNNEFFDSHFKKRKQKKGILEN